MPVSLRTRLKQEEWKGVPGDPTLLISNMGRKNRRGRILPNKGLVWVRDRGPTKIAVLVLELFVGPCPDGMECCHYDDNPLNNALSNLRWDTHKSNMQDRNRNGKGNENKINGENCYCAKLTDDLVMEARRLHLLDPKLWTSVRLAEMMEVSQRAMWKALNRKSWKHIL